MLTVSCMPQIDISVMNQNTTKSFKEKLECNLNEESELISLSLLPISCILRAWIHFLLPGGQAAVLY